MYDEAADLSAHVREIDDMDAALSHGGLVVDWPKHGSATLAVVEVCALHCFRRARGGPIALM